MTRDFSPLIERVLAGVSKHTYTVRVQCCIDTIWCDIFKFYDSAKSFIEHGSYKPSLYGTMFLLLQAIILSRAMSEELYEMDSVRIFYMMPQIVYF